VKSVIDWRMSMELVAVTIEHVTIERDVPDAIRSDQLPLVHADVATTAGQPVLGLVFHVRGRGPDVQGHKDYESSDIFALAVQPHYGLPVMLATTYDERGQFIGRKEDGILSIPASELGAFLFRIDPQPYPTVDAAMEGLAHTAATQSRTPVHEDLAAPNADEFAGQDWGHRTTIECLVIPPSTPPSVG
jgi:hypothetical protein